MSHARKRRRRRRVFTAERVFSLIDRYEQAYIREMKQLYWHMYYEGHQDELTASDYDWMNRHGGPVRTWPCCPRRHSPAVDFTFAVVEPDDPEPAAPLELTEWSSQWLDSPNWPELPEWGSPDCPHRTVDGDGEIW